MPPGGSAPCHWFARRFTEGPGVCYGRGYETTDGGTTWTDVSANLPDVLASSIKALPDGSLVLATDLALFCRAPHATAWQRLGSGLPLTVSVDIEYYAPADTAYLVIHGRGIWSIPLP
ncbi:hypothetical protein [Catellatospora tritici]|uniref:hypothetical protein n=1 Tax=Catellatospora tritici TaxID=2851566 RepID=UPI001C2CF400|nr:hypothetical protein [Catellatospora tritici]MBV1854458.1 hypothetical protein [Catellatospora tritici]